MRRNRNRDQGLLTFVLNRLSLTWWGSLRNRFAEESYHLSYTAEYNYYTAVLERNSSFLRSTLEKAEGAQLTCLYKHNWIRYIRIIAQDTDR